MRLSLFLLLAILSYSNEIVELKHLDLYRNLNTSEVNFKDTDTFEKNIDKSNHRNVFDLAKDESNDFAMEKENKAYQGLEGKKYYSKSTLSCLNKVTGKSKLLSIDVGESKFFGDIQISVKKCYKTYRDDFESSNIFLEITEHRMSDDSKAVFRGWMISGNPAVSTVTHPIYEIFAYNCFALIEDLHSQ